MRALLLALLAAAVLTSPATATWQIETEIDPLTDAKHTFATVHAQGAAFTVQCLNSKVTPLIRFDRPVAHYRIGAAYRFDQQLPAIGGRRADGMAVARK